MISPDKCVISDIAGFENKIRLKLPLFASRIKAGFPSQADDYIDRQIDFNELLVKHPAATFCVKVSGNSMTGAGIHSGDTLVVDRALTPAHNSIVIAAVYGELTVKRVSLVDGQLFLISENPDYEPIKVDEAGFEIWGVVTYVLHKAE